MKTNNYKFVSYLFLAIFLTIGISVSLQSLVLAWTSPLGTAPDYNTNPLVLNDSGDIDFPVVSKPFTVNNNFHVGGNQFFVGTDGRVGIGTNSPSQVLEVTSGYIRAGAGLVVENRSVAPVNPVDGQIWLMSF